MKPLDMDAVVATLATSTGRPHMIIGAGPRGIEALRGTSATRFVEGTVDMLEAQGFAIVSFGSFVEAALDFCAVQDEILADRLPNVSLRLVQADGSVRQQNSVAAIVDMPLGQAA